MLLVDRLTGTSVIFAPGAGNALDISDYLLISESGSLNVAGWHSRTGNTDKPDTDQLANHQPVKSYSCGRELR